MENSSSAGFAHAFRAGTDASSPLLLLLHGTGGDEHDLLPLGAELSPGSPMLSPRGRVSEHGMNRFFRRIAEGVFDLEDLAHRTRELSAFVRHAAVEQGLEGRRILAVGFSNGANMAVSLLFQEPDLLCGAVLFRPMLPYQPEPAARLDGIPVFIGQGMHDAMVPADQPQRLADALEQVGADVMLHREPTGHRLTESDVTAARAWIMRTFRITA